jgi:hypothetical protein
MLWYIWKLPGRCRGFRTLVKEIGLDGKLTDWLSRLSADCPRKNAHSFSDRCDVRCPDLSKLYQGQGQ